MVDHSTNDTVEVYEAKDGWRWRRKAANGEIIASGESHGSLTDSMRAAARATSFDPSDIKVIRD